LITTVMLEAELLVNTSYSANSNCVSVKCCM